MSVRKLLSLAVLVSLMLTLLPVVQAKEETPTTPTAVQTEAMLAAYGQLPLYFEANQGQTDSSVRYLARGGGYTLFLTESRAAFSLVIDQPTQTYGLFMDFVGANAHPTLSGEDIQAGISSYFTGSPEQWQTNLAHYGKVRYADLYTGIDAIFYGNPQQLQYDFEVAPYANPEQIQLRFDPAEKLTLTASGDLEISLGEQNITMQAPYAYQVVNGEQVTVASHFKVVNGVVSFALGTYDRHLPLVIDPVLVYAGYLGGVGTDAGNSIAVDSSGNVYVTGDTDSPAASFPVLA